MIAQYEPEFGEEERVAVSNYMSSGAWLTEHQETVRFEEAISKSLGGKARASVVNNGTISLSLALLALGVRPRDRVIVPDLTMIATANAVTLIGATPVLCDVDPTNLCLDLDLALTLARLWEARAVLYVSLNGRSHPAAQLCTFRGALGERGGGLVEDAAQSLGSLTPDGVPIGTIGDLGSFSFSPHKIVSTGQGGCIVSPTQEMYEKVERLKDFGRLSGGSDVHDHFGINSKFTDLQAMVGIEQMKKLPARIQKKKDIYDRYRSKLDGVPVVLPPMHGGTPWFVDVYTERRDELAAFLAANGVKTRPLYPALHTQKIFGRPAEPFPVSTTWSSKGLWLPSSFKLSGEEIDTVCRLVREFLP